MPDINKGMNIIYTSDRVDVVRCYQCKHYSPEFGSCANRDIYTPDGDIEHRLYVAADWYCADGERDDNADGT